MHSTIRKFVLLAAICAVIAATLIVKPRIAQAANEWCTHSTAWSAPSYYSAEGMQFKTQGKYTFVNSYYVGWTHVHKYTEIHYQWTKHPTSGDWILDSVEGPFTDTAACPRH